MKSLPVNVSVVSLLKNCVLSNPSNVSASPPPPPVWSTKVNEPDPSVDRTWLDVPSEMPRSVKVEGIEVLPAKAVVEVVPSCKASVMP